MRQRYLESECEPICAGAGCFQVTKMAPTGRWYITMGHAGFNSPANNRNGYKSSLDALKATRRYSSRRNS